MSEIRKINFLNPNFELKKVAYPCKVHGLVQCDAMVVNDVMQNVVCPLCEAEKENEVIRERENQQAKIKFEENKKQKNIEREYWNKNFDSFEVLSESQGKALEAVKKLVQEKHGKVILLGTNGCGKTMLGSIAVDMLGGKIYSMYEISCMIRQCYSSLAKRTELEIVDELASIPMLVIDEIGRTKGSDAELNWLSYILDKRHTRNLPFMLLTNTHLKKHCSKGGCERCFENFVDNDILSRLRQDSRVITVEAPDYRTRRK